MVMMRYCSALHVRVLFVESVTDAFGTTALVSHFRAPPCVGFLSENIDFGFSAYKRQEIGVLWTPSALASDIASGSEATNAK